jgi:hypothetical protein
LNSVIDAGNYSIDMTLTFELLLTCDVMVWCGNSEAGESIVTVAFKSNENDRMNILFAIKKRCAGVTAEEGVAIAGLNIGRGVSNESNY